MDFIASMTHRKEELQQILSLWEQYGDDRLPFKRTIFTPLFARPGVTDFIYQQFAATGGIIFDSGGYFVQQGVISYEELYKKLMAYYAENDWGDWYVLPDYVPTSDLSPEEVEARVQATITVGKTFFAEMPKHLRSRALPVVQGHTREQVLACVDAYAELGVQRVGFGSFGTSGDNNSINMITQQSIQMVAFLKEKTDQYGLKLHLFGIGTPGVLPLFYSLGIDSFDSSCWSRTAGYGNVYLPFQGRRNLSARMLREIGGSAYRPAKFRELKDASGHDCPFCHDVEVLKRNRIYQMMHNLCVMLDTVAALNRGEIFVPELIGLDQSRYKSYRIQTD